MGFVIPALNEEGAIGNVVEGLRARGISQIVVCDNGSTDETASVARSAGATVVHEPERGYGAACLKAISALSQATEIIGFVDGDGSDNLDDLEALLSPLLREEADFVIASRALGEAEQGALTPPQRFGNWIASSWLKYRFGQQTSDLGPFRAIRKSAYQRLKMQDRNYGWTVEMQIKAAQHKLKYAEFPTNYACRIGQSRSRYLWERLEPALKLSGFYSGTISAEVARIHDLLYRGPRYRVGTHWLGLLWVNINPTVNVVLPRHPISGLVR